MCKLRNLEELDLSNNRFEGNLPPCLGNLTSLHYLDLFSNDFKREIPASLFSNLNLLKFISLSYNYFEGSFSFTPLLNNSQLVVFDLVNYNKTLKVEIENPTWFPPFHLEVFRLSNCSLSTPTKAVPSFLLNQHELQMLDLSHSGMTGKVPTWLLVNNTALEFLSIGSNILTGPLDLQSNSTNLNLVLFDISSNLIHGEVPPYIGSVLPNLHVLNMSGNALQGYIPPSVDKMEELRSLDLSFNNFSGPLPRSLFMGSSYLRVLILSNNNLHGNIPKESKLTGLGYLFLENNNLSGEISEGLLESSSLELLDISNNSFSGVIPDWIGNFSLLTSLVLSRNSLEGEIPTGFCKLNKLLFLDLSENKIGPASIPPCANLSTMKYLHLHSNELTALIPYVLSEARSLITLDLRDNKLSGTIPPWISSLSNLRVLLLKGNRFQDSIPAHLCQLKKIRIMDLSHNNLSGSIPSCFNQIITFGRKGAREDKFGNVDYVWAANLSLSTYSYEEELSHFRFLFGVGDAESGEGDVVEFISKSRSESYAGSILHFMSGMDLSDNKLTGPIPREMGYLSGIHTINLSHNHFSGPIPETFSNLKEVESLDISYNELTGQIPPQLIELNNLAVFSVAHNNLSGKTPEMKFQFMTFDQSSYEGNPLLCGLPLERSCTPTGPPPATPPTSEKEEIGSWKAIFLWSFVGSYGVAFLGIAAFLYLSSYYRELLFDFIEAHVSFLRLRTW